MLAERIQRPFPARRRPHGVFGVCTAPASCQAGTTGGLGGELNGPEGVATDADGNVYVADFENNRIQEFDAAGSFERAWGRNVNGGGVYGICTAPASCQAGTTGGLGGELYVPFGVATDTAGNVYVADGGNQRIQQFAAPPETGITKATVSAKRHRASFKFVAVGQADGFRCELKRPKPKGHPKPKAVFSPCSTPKAYKHLKSGHYSFAVAAFNKAGADATPARKNFKIK